MLRLLQLSKGMMELMLLLHMGARLPQAHACAHSVLG